MSITPAPEATPVADSFGGALRATDTVTLARLADTTAISSRDRFATLRHIYDLHTAPVDLLGARARLQHHPAVSALKQRCEADWLDELEAIEMPADLQAILDADGAAAAMRALAARDRLPAVYRWVSDTASWPDVVTFLALEGGPDAGFDDLVAACQIGLSGPTKMELAQNYWDEMGNGEHDAVHTRLHDRLVEAIGIRNIPCGEQPASALARNCLGGLLATNRWLQPEMLGALGLIELQAGPRCRLVLKAFDRCGAPPDAYPFYEVHADVDPRHGKDWLDKVVDPTVTEQPSWASRIARGALWRSHVNAVFHADVSARFEVTVHRPTRGRAAAA